VSVNNRTSLNVPNGGTGFINLASVWQPTSQANGQPLPPSLADANGYPNNTTLAANYSGNNPLIPNYNGKYALQYNGQGTVSVLDAAIIYSGAAAVSGSGGLVTGGGPAGTGYVFDNMFTIGSAVSPSVVFKFGGLVAGVSGGGGVSNVTIQTAATLKFTGVPTGTKVWFNQGCSANLVNGPNSDGSWTVTKVDSTHFTLNNSIGLIGPTVTGSGGVGTQTEVIFSRSGGSMQYSSGTAFSGFTNLVLCAQPNLTLFNGGQYWDPVFIAQLQALKGTPGGIGRAGNFWLRFMDVCLSARNNFDPDYSQRLTTSSQCWIGGNNFPLGYVTPSTSNQITNGGSDNYTCADPTVSVLSGGNYLDNAIVQGVPTATNSTGNPTLAVGTGPAKPIFDLQAYGYVLRISSLPTTPGTDVLQFTFTATWLNSGTPVVVNYSTVASDNTNANLTNHLVSFLNAQTTLTNAGIIFNTPNGSIGPGINPPTAQAGRLSVNYSGTAGITYTTSIAPSTIGVTNYRTFIYNYLLDGWLYSSSGLSLAYPIESIIQLCNLVGANCWYNINFAKASYITSITQAVGDSVTGLTSGLQFGIEGWNETWNPSANPHGLLQLLGRCFTWTDGGNQSDCGYTGLRTLQYLATASSAWTGKGRNASDIYMMQMAQLGQDVTSGYNLYQLQGQKLVTSNTFYANYGGLNGGTAPDHSTAPNRPVDFPTVFIGQAPYWNNHYFGNDSFTFAGQVQGTVAQNSTMLQAALDYSNGLTSSAFTALSNSFNRVGTVGPNSSGYDFTQMQTWYTRQEAIAASYDAGRTIKVGINHYEGGPSFGIGANGNNGVNSADNQLASLASGDITALANQITALAWDTSPYTGGTSNPTLMAQMILEMLQGWKYDLNANGTAAGLNSYKNMIKTSYYQALFNTSGANRETHAGQYGYSGSNWGFMNGAYNTVQNFYANYPAMTEWNTASGIMVLTT
jgi:hypothetical protein